MTDETKLEILNYVVNNIEPTAPNYDEIFLEQNEISRDEWVDFIPSWWNNFRYEGMVAGNELTTNLTVLYGGYIDADNNSCGIITLVDENFIPVKTIYEYSSGTKLRYIQYMKQAEDGTFYFIDDNVYSYRNQQNVENSQKRFVMTNNFTLINQLSGNYDVILRKSYIFGDSYKNFYCKNMYKDEYSSSYIFFGTGVDTNTHNDFRRLRIMGLKIQVGIPNEWTMYYDDTDNSTNFGSAIAVFDGENVKFRCLCSSVYSSARTIECVSKTLTGNVQRNSIVTFSFHPYVDDTHYKKQSVFINYDEVYFVQNNQRWRPSTPNNKYIGLYKYNFNNNGIVTIYEKSLGVYSTSDIEAIYIDRCNTELYISYVNNINDSGNTTYGDYYFQRLVNDRWKPILIGTQQKFIYDRRTIYIKNNFNLLQIFIYGTNPQQINWYWHLIKEDYNQFNYNGTSYIGYDTLVSKKGQIYSNNKLVFARNLYNKNIYQNSCVSTIQVPNNYLNGIQLDLKKLISNTNFDICNENNITDKNIYEMMFVNYINTIICIDEDTNTIYGNTANYINENINTGTKANYDNTKMSKVRINFTTPQIQLINWTWNVDHYETSFTIYTDEVPTSVEFISNDETTTYLTKQIEGLEINKYYTISQKIRIE